jgi:hypothetical protein
LNLKKDVSKGQPAPYADRTEEAYGSFSQLKAPTVGLLTFWRLCGKYSVVFVVDVFSSSTEGLASIRFPFDGLVFNDLNFFLTRSMLKREVIFRATSTQMVQTEMVRRDCATIADNHGYIERKFTMKCARHPGTSREADKPPRS